MNKFNMNYGLGALTNRKRGRKHIRSECVDDEWVRKVIGEAAKCKRMTGFQGTPCWRYTFILQDIIVVPTDVDDDALWWSATVAINRPKVMLWQRCSVAHAYESTGISTFQVAVWMGWVWMVLYSVLKLCWTFCDKRHRDEGNGMSLSISKPTMCTVHGNGNADAGCSGGGGRQVAKKYVTDSPSSVGGICSAIKFAATFSWIRKLTKWKVWLNWKKVLFDKIALQLWGDEYWNSNRLWTRKLMSVHFSPSAAFN